LSFSSSPDAECSLYVFRFTCSVYILSANLTLFIFTLLPIYDRITTLYSLYVCYLYLIKLLHVVTLQFHNKLCIYKFYFNTFHHFRPDRRKSSPTDVENLSLFYFGSNVKTDPSYDVIEVEWKFPSTQSCN